MVTWRLQTHALINTDQHITEHYCKPYSAYTIIYSNANIIIINYASDSFAKSVCLEFALRHRS